MSTLVCPSWKCGRRFFRCQCSNYFRCWCCLHSFQRYFWHTSPSCPPWADWIVCLRQVQGLWLTTALQARCGGHLPVPTRASAHPRELCQLCNGCVQAPGLVAAACIWDFAMPTCSAGRSIFLLSPVLRGGAYFCIDVVWKAIIYVTAMECNGPGRCVQKASLTLTSLKAAVSVIWIWTSHYCLSDVEL